MKYIDEFRDKKLVDALIKEIKALGITRANFMEVCGTHTVAIFRSGLRGLIGGSISLISGPGCPVCVTAQSDIDRMIALARIKNVVIATFGDMLKVPGTESSLEKERALGADIRVVYSPADSLAIARDNKSKEIVFLGVGFETTSPLIASIVDDAKKLSLHNFSVYSCHKLIPPAMKSLLDAEEVHIDGFICPGHVSSIIGSTAYEFICRDYGIPCVVTGFEPVDILESLLMLMRQSKSRRAGVAIQYKRAVKAKGNIVARAIIDRVFEPVDCQWRGLGSIPGSGLRLRRLFQDFDAGKKFRIKAAAPRENPACSCGEILRGIKNPGQCPLFAKTCTPENPFGPCMVSTEGTCGAWFKYNRLSRDTPRGAQAS